MAMAPPSPPINPSSSEPVNDAPVVSGVVDLGSMEEDGTFRITSEQLLAKASDVDGDELSI